jgi:hypothetical protein
MSEKFTTPGACLSIPLLRYVRDHAPTEADFLTWIGGWQNAGRYHTLRKAGLLLLEQGRLRLSPQHLSPDGKRFAYSCRIFQLGTDEVWWIRRKKDAPARKTND